MRFYLGPGNNSLSHVLKCLSIKEFLIKKGHDVFIGVSKSHSGFLKILKQRHFIVPDIGNCDGSNFPTFKWFSRPDRILACIREQAALIKKISPDRVLGVFNFTLKISAALAGVPYDAMSCGCMLRESPDILGFHGNEPEASDQRINLETFFSFATRKIRRALGKSLDFNFEDVRDLLKGETTFLWDIPEFMALISEDNICNTGPIFYKNRLQKTGWEGGIPENTGKRVLISFGTCSGEKRVMQRLVDICLSAGFDVYIAAGGQKDLHQTFLHTPRVKVSFFADLRPLLSRADLFICHGGQISIFEAINAQVPTLVMPFQPEQAHNGICLERTGCGSLLVPPRPFRSNAGVYLDALADLNDQEIEEQIRRLCDDAEIKANVLKMKQALEKYTGVQMVVSGLLRK